VLVLVSGLMLVAVDTTVLALVASPTMIHAGKDIEATLTPNNRIVDRIVSLRKSTW